MAWIFFFWTTIFFLFLMANLLIAIMGEVYGEVLQKTRPVFLRSRAEICLELEQSISNQDPKRRQNPALFPRYLLLSFPSDKGDDASIEYEDGTGGMIQD